MWGMTSAVTSPPAVRAVLAARFTSLDVCPLVCIFWTSCCRCTMRSHWSTSGPSTSHLQGSWSGVYGGPTGHLCIDHSSADVAVVGLLLSWLLEPSSPSVVNSVRPRPWCLLHVIPGLSTPQAQALAGSTSHPLALSLTRRHSGSGATSSSGHLLQSSSQGEPQIFAVLDPHHARAATCAIHLVHGMQKTCDRPSNKLTFRRLTSACLPFTAAHVQELAD
jgi:hypothetical protein